MNTTRHAAFAHPSALTARLSGRHIMHLYEAGPRRAARFNATLDDLLLDHVKSPIDDAARKALFALAEPADLDWLRRRLFTRVAVTTGTTRKRSAIQVNVGIDGSGLAPTVMTGSATIGRSDAHQPANFPRPVPAAHDGATAALIARFHAPRGEA